jgi:pyruvate dehydrogenase E1 component alpha subunit
MGTSIDRHSSISDYYKMGNAIPGLRIDGMNVLAVKEGVRFAKEYAGSGNGPIYLEMMTYRYHGHSMSDPGTTYRNREEIEFTRTTRDPLEFIRKCMIDSGYMTTEDIKEVEKSIRKDVQSQVKKAKESIKPPLSELATCVYAADLTPYNQEYPEYIRMPDMAKSLYFPKK